ncbi:MlaD family protein [Desulfovibrio sp. UCD-KL4C]|uniref:MlaD family protein n=1 Tax=Desulfovibrio sp. UCD-KL4C TaxID=2578120 RepID=UPI0025C54218|nr:MlaD family protein [Desulfovibrio sp. UCD-KL4C]
MVLNPRSSKADIIKAGLATFAGLIVLGLFIVFLGGHDFFFDYSTYKIQFLNIKDLTSGRPVKYAGLSVGKVKSIEVNKKHPEHITVVINVDKDFDLYEGTVATITQKGLVGDNYILLELQSDPGPKLVPGSVIPVALTLSMSDVAAEIGKAVAAVAPKLEKAVDGLQVLLTGENRESLEKSLKIAPSVLMQTNATLVSFQKEWIKLSRTASIGIQSGTRNLETLTFEVSTTLNQARKVLETLSRDVKQTLQNMDDEVSKVADGVNGLTVDLRKNLEYDQEELEAILLNINRLTNEMNRLARSLRERPWQVLNPPEGAQK